MKEWHLYSHKSELPDLGSSKKLPVLGISSVWEWQNDAVQQIEIRTKTVFSDPGETGIVKKHNIKMF